MPTPPLKASQEVECARLAICGRNDCRRQFSMCGGCDHGRRYCGAACASAARRDSLRRAARAYQRTERGRRLHADRQARYRARLSRVTHQSQPNPPETAKITPLSVGSDRPRAPVAPQGGYGGAGIPDRGSASACLVCAQPHIYHRVGFRRPRRRRLRAEARAGRRCAPKSLGRANTGSKRAPGDGAQHTEQLPIVSGLHPVGRAPKSGQRCGLRVPAAPQSARHLMFTGELHR
jgi:hypothetical protein